MIPLPQIVAELVMALGAALLAANVLALVRPRLRPDGARVQARGRAVVNGGIGLVVFVWGFASFFAARG